MHPARILFFVGIAATLASCAGAGGGPNGTPVVPSQAARSTDSRVSKRLSATLIIHVPRHRRHRRFGSKFISPSTQSIVIAAQETAPASGSPQMTYANIVAGSPNCTGSGPSLPYTCTVRIDGLAGGATYSLTFVTYDHTQTSATGPYAGNALAQNTVSKTILVGEVNNINVTLDGIPASFSVAPISASPPKPFGGSVASGLYFGVFDTPTLTITALDADQNYIVGPGSPTITASVSGATGGVAIAPATGNNPNQFVVSATAIGSGTLQLSAPVPGSSTPLNVNVPLNAGTLTSTIAGGSNAFVDGTGPQAAFESPEGITYNPVDGKLYVGDYYNCAIRKVDPQTHAVSTYAGDGSGHCAYQNGTGTGAFFDNPCSVAIDGSGNLYVPEYTTNLDIRKIAPGGVVTLFTGNNGSGNTDGGPGTAQFEGPVGITYDPDDNDLYVTDYTACTVRRVTVGGATPGTVSTIAGTAGSCNATGSNFNQPEGLMYGGSGTLYVADSSNCEVRKISNVDSVTPTVDTNAAPFAGSHTNCNSADGTGVSAGFSFPFYIAYDSVRNVLYVSDDGTVIRKVTLAGAVTTLAGKIGTQGLGTGWNSLLYGPNGITYDPALNAIFETDASNDLVQEIQL